jgi:drug/metabolite transporter (DMT)-like permease
LSGAAWAAVSGIGFGVFQALNARAVRSLASAYLSTFLQLLTATTVLAAVVAGTAELSDVTDVHGRALVMFALSGLVHFTLGWTTLNLSQQRIGAARTAPLLATSPLFGLVFAFAVHGDLPGLVALAGMAVTMLGAYLITRPDGGGRSSLRDTGFAWGTAAAWALSALFTVEGFRQVEDPLVGVTVSLCAASLAYGVLMLVVREPVRLRGSGGALALKLFAGVVVALATWSRWLGLETASVGVVLALQLLSVPVVLLLAPMVAHRGVEDVPPRLWGGSTVVVAGALVLILAG